VTQSAPEDPRWLDSADALSRRLIARAHPIHFTVAATPAELDAVFRLRHEIVTEHGWLPPDDLREPTESDEYDEKALQIAAWDGDTLAGTLRLIPPRHDRPLPVEAAYGLVVEPRGEVIGAGRVIVARPYRDAEHQVLGGLSATAWLLMHKLGFRWAAGTATSEILDLFEHLGFEVTVLGDPQAYWGEERYPIRMGAADPSRWASGSTGIDRGSRLEVSVDGEPSIDVGRDL